MQQVKFFILEPSSSPSVVASTSELSTLLTYGPVWLHMGLRLAALFDKTKDSQLPSVGWGV